MKKFFRDYLIQVLAGITILVVSGVWALIDLNSLKRLWINILIYRIPVWCIIIGLVVLWLILYMRKRMKSTDVPSYPDFLQYTEDNIDGIRYRWTYEKVDNQYNITDLRVFCPKCNALMKYVRFGYGGRNYECPYSECRTSIHVDEENIGAIIKSKIINKEYKMKLKS